MLLAYKEKNQSVKSFICIELWSTRDISVIVEKLAALLASKASVRTSTQVARVACVRDGIVLGRDAYLAVGPERYRFKDACTLSTR